MPFGTEFGGFFYGGSGTPVSALAETDNGIPVIVNGRGDRGRTPVVTQTDFLVGHEISMGEDGGKCLRFEFNVINVFNHKTARHIYAYVNRE